VKVGRKGLHAYAQRKYVALARQDASGVAPTSVATPSIEGALTQVLPSARVPLALALTAFASPDSAKAVVRVSVDAGAFAHADGAAVPLDVAVMAVDATGRTLASARQTSTISGGGATADGPREVYVASHLELAPGDYGIRVAVLDPASGKVASVFSDVTVPPFESAPLSLSGVNVELVRPPSATPAATTSRIFRRTDQVRAVMQIYQGTGRTEAIAPVAMRVQILDAKGTSLRDETLPLAEQAFTNRRADCVITLPLSKLPAGEYLLKLEASSGRHTSGRALRFGVE
jgi:hypothetical protein